jgi:hypothetical protein
MITSFNLHITYFITNILKINSEKLITYQELKYEHHHPMPLLVYLHHFKSNPYPLTHPITKILIKLFNKPFYD